MGGTRTQVFHCTETVCCPPSHCLHTSPLHIEYKSCLLHTQVNCFENWMSNTHIKKKNIKVQHVRKPPSCNDARDQHNQTCWLWWLLTHGAHSDTKAKTRKHAAWLEGGRREMGREGWEGMEGVGWLSRRISDFLFKHHLNEMIQGKQDKALHRAGWAAAASSCLLYLPLPSPDLFGGVRELGWGGKEIKNTGLH